MSETLRERLDNLEMFLRELVSEGSDGIMSDAEIKSQASYHLVTMDALNNMLEDKE